MGELAYSFHLSSKGHAVGTIGKVGQVSKHNLRAYQSDEYDRNLISVLAGSETSILDSVKKIYEEEFSDALEDYNGKRREDRQIKDYLTHVSQSRNDVAAEIIIQIGDKEFWQDKTPEQFRSMDKVFKEQLRDLERLLPAFKVSSAVVHYDESSPHMHVVGVPVAEGGARGMKKQCVKTKVFTKDSLEMLQDEMRIQMLQQMDSMPELFAGSELKEKKKGRNQDLPKYMLEALRVAEGELDGLKQEVKTERAELDTIREEKNALTSQNEAIKAEIKRGKKEVNAINNMRDAILNEYAAAAESTAIVKDFIKYTQIKEPKSDLGRRVVAIWKDFSEFWKQKHPNYADHKKESIRDKLKENQREVARKEADRPQRTDQNIGQDKIKHRDQER